MPSFEEEVHRYQDRVYGFAFHYLHRREAAEDVTQEVLVRFWQHRDSLESDALPWLLRVTRNACIDALRHRSTRRDVFAGDAEEVRRARSRRASPQADAEAADFRAHLDRALDELGEPYRSLVILREIQGFSYKDISQTLDLPLGTVKGYLHRARKRLRHYLAEATNHELA